MVATSARALRIALVGTRGVPARYGGFETCVEEVGARLVERGHDVLVYCRGEQDAGRRTAACGSCTCRRVRNARWRP